MKSEPAPTISKEQVCRLCKDYYDSQVSDTDFVMCVTGEVCKMILFGDTYSNTASTNQNAKDAAMRILQDSDLFSRELFALNIELFGLAWFEYNYRLCLSGEQGQEQTNSAVCTEIMFTKWFLEEYKWESDIWNAMGFYNDTILQAAIAQETSIDWSAFRDRGYYDRQLSSPKKNELEQKLKVEQPMRKEYAEMFEKLCTEKECVTRLLNRLYSVDAWQEGIVIPQRLSSAFVQRLGLSTNVKELFPVERVTVGMYKNASDYIDTVVTCGSWELAMKESDALMNRIKRHAAEFMEKKLGLPHDKGAL